MNEFYAGLAEILEVDAEQVTPQLDLTAHAWDSLGVVSTIALIDECFNLIVDGQKLGNCTSVADILALIESSKKG